MGNDRAVAELEQFLAERADRLAARPQHARPAPEAPGGRAAPWFSLIQPPCLP